MTTRILDTAKLRFPKCIVDWDERSEIFTIVWGGWNDHPHEQRLEDVQLMLAGLDELGRFKHLFALTPAELAIFHSL